MNTEQIKLYTEVREKRAQLEKKAAELKEIEANIKAEILMNLEAQGLESCKEGGYTLSRKHTVRAEVTDHTKLQECMFNLMSAAKAEGRPLQDGVLLQRTVSKSAVIDYIRHGLSLQADDDLNILDEKTKSLADSIGIKLVDVIDLSVRKTK